MPWLQSAAERGEPRAMYVLGIASYNGDYAPKDWVRAYALITRAAASGLPQATASLATMNQTIPLAQRQMGVSLAGELEQRAADARGRELAAADLGGQNTRPALPAPKPAPGPIEKVDLPPSTPAEPVVAYLPPPFEPEPAPSPPPPPPAPKPVPPKPVPVKPAASRPAPTLAGGTYRIQLGAFGVKANADALWARVRTRPEVAGHARQDLPGTVTRLLATGYSQSGAERACAALKAGGLACLVVAP
jgi:cell division septation protein DedD